MKLVQHMGATMRKSAGVAVWVVCFCALLLAGPAQAQSGDQLFAQAEKALAAGQNAEAADLYSKAIRSAQLAKQTLTKAFLKRGRAQQLTGNHARAVADFTNALWLESLGPDDVARAHGWRGASRQALGQDKLANEDLAKAKSVDPQFVAGPVPAAAPGETSGETLARSEPGSSGDLIDRIFGGDSNSASAPRVARRVEPQSPAAAPASEAPAGQAGAEQPGLFASLFSTEVKATSRPEPTNNGVTVRRPDNSAAANAASAPPAVTTTVSDLDIVRPAPPPASQNDILSRILTEPGTGSAGDGLARPRAKPDGATDRTSPVHLASLAGGPAPTAANQNVAPTPSATGTGSASGRSLLNRIFGTPDNGSPPPRVATVQQTAQPSIVRPETTLTSESRVASAPPWQLGARNASASEERAALPPVVSGTSSGFLSRTRAPAPASVASVGRQPIAVPRPTAPARTPQIIASPPRKPVAPVVARPAAPLAAPVARPIEQKNVARVAWTDATQVQRIAPPAPAAAPQVRRSASAPAVQAQPAPARAAAIQRDAGTAARQTAAPQPVGQSIASRLFQVAEQAFTGVPPTQPQTPPQRVAAINSAPATDSRSVITPRPRATAVPKATRVVVPTAQTGGTGYAVQLAAERSLDAASAKAGAVSRRHGDLLAGVKPYVVKADVPGKGTYYRVRVGPYRASQQVATLCQQLKGRGQDCFTTHP